MGKIYTFSINHSLIISVFLALIYIAFQIISGLFMANFVSSLQYILFLWISFAVTFGLNLILLLIIVPLGFNLPNGDTTVKTYLEGIKLDRINPWKRNIGLVVIFVVIYSLSLLTVALLSGTFIFDPSIIFGWPEPGKLGIFIFVQLLSPGIWEEVAFRGVILTLLFKKYSTRKAITIDGIIFGCSHFVNLLTGADLIMTLLQIMFATTIGFAFAYLYFKTESLIPSILAHYLVDSIVPLFLNVTNPNIVVVIISTLTLFVTLAPILNILIIKAVVKKQED